MTLGNRTLAWALLAALAAGCSSGSSDGDGPIAMQSAVQDLGVDPDGTTTILTFAENPGPITTAQVQADGGQSALTVVRTGSQLSVVWDERVTPSDRVRMISTVGVSDAWKSVTTTDATAPTFVVSNAVQQSDDAPGGDTIELTFSGPRVVEELAEDPGSWELEVGGTVRDLTGSVFTLDVPSQVLSITLGVGANLHSSFDIRATSVASVADVDLSSSFVTGAAAGDGNVPAVTSVEQRVAVVDPLGRVVDFVFSKPMDMTLTALPGHFSVDDHAGAVGITLTVSAIPVDDYTVRVTFDRPVAPGHDTLTFGDLTDYHGLVLSGSTVAIGNAEASGGNSFVSVTGTTVADAGGDKLEVVTVQPLDPDFAVDPARWTVLVDGSPVVLADQLLTYDLATSTLTIGLDFDMHNGDTIDVTSVSQVDVDGEDFSVAAAQVNASGDAVEPFVVGATQDRTEDQDGQALVVEFSEDMDPVLAETTGMYVFTPAVTVNTATVQPGGHSVLLETDSVLTPGEFTLTVTSLVEDLAGNAMVGDDGPWAITSTDTTAPSVSFASATALAGADNDALVVTFDDDMLETEVENLANWNFESPIGSPYALSGESVQYNANARIAVLRLDAGGQMLRGADDFSIAFVSARDVAGNTIDPSAYTGQVTAESVRPDVHAVWRDSAPDDDELVVRFSEPSGPFDDLYHPSLSPLGTMFFAVRDSGGALRGYPTGATSVDGGLGVRLSYGFVIALSDTLDVIGLTDQAGNTMFPSMATPIAAEDATAPALDAVTIPLATAVSGERNDTLVVTFNTPMSPWQVTNPANYQVVTNPGGVTIDVSGSTFAWDGNDTLTITLDALSDNDLQASAFYDVALLVGGDPLTSAQGVPIAAQDDDNVGVDGDTTNGPSQGGSLAVADTGDPNSLLVIFEEAVDEAAAETAANYDLNSGNIAQTATLVGPRVVRVGFLVPVAAGSLDIAQPSAKDLAGNETALGMTLGVVSDTAPPNLLDVSAAIGVGAGGDRVMVQYSEQVEVATAQDRDNYVVTNGAPLDLSGASLSYDSVTATVTIALPSGVELNPASSVQVDVLGVADVAGNVIGTVVSLSESSIGGDSTPPSVAQAFVNYAEDGFGSVVDVRFDEDVDVAFAGNLGNWSATGASSVTGVEVIDGDHVRVTLDALLGPGDELVVASGLPDTAGNVTVADLHIDPVDGLE